MIEKRVESKEIEAIKQIPFNKIFNKINDMGIELATDKLKSPVELQSIEYLHNFEVINNNDDFKIESSIDFNSTCIIKISFEISINQNIILETLIVYKKTQTTPIVGKPKYLKIIAPSRGANDCSVPAKLMPKMEKEVWKPIIDIDKGQILDWKYKSKVSTWYKVVDEGIYIVLDENHQVIKKVENYYVPDILCPDEKGYGDYIDMTISTNGMIKNWNKDLIDELLENDE